MKEWFHKHADALLEITLLLMVLAWLFGLFGCTGSHQAGGLTHRQVNEAMSDSFGRHKIYSGKDRRAIQVALDDYLSLHRPKALIGYFTECSTNPQAYDAEVSQGIVENALMVTILLNNSYCGLPDGDVVTGATYLIDPTKWEIAGSIQLMIPMENKGLE